jgi:lipopolysaccharide/colanic/teichoic acid biosynthesis glycosyltransferase
VIDIQYIEEWSFWLDIRILVGTLWVLLRQKNTTPNASKT